MDLSALTPFAASILLHIVRVGSFFIAANFLGAHRDSRLLRLVLGVSFALIFWWVGDHKTLDFEGILPFTVAMSIEMLVGLAAGFVISLIAAAMALAGEMISHDMGFAMSQVLNPVTGQTSPVISQFFQTIVALIIFALDIHHDFIRVLAACFETLPVGRGFDPAVVFHNLTYLVSHAITMGTRYALPIMGVLVLLTAMLVMLARAVQNINLMEFSFGLRILLGLSATIYFLSHGTPFLLRITSDFVDGARLLFVAH